MASIREDCLRIPCPRCHAWIGEPCTYRGKPSDRFHRDRQYRAARLKFADPT